jgi:hypothetical protein
LSFWYGLSFAEVAAMPLAAIQAYLERIPQRMAEAKLILGEAASMPHMKENQRKSAINGWLRMAQAANTVPSGAVVSETVLRARLKLMGIGGRNGNTSEPG